MCDLVEKVPVLKEIDKARAEYHSFMSVRTLWDIRSSYKLVETMLRLELNLVNAINKLNKINSAK